MFYFHPYLGKWSNLTTVIFFKSPTRKHFKNGWFSGIRSEFFFKQLLGIPGLSDFTQKRSGKRSSRVCYWDELGIAWYLKANHFFLTDASGETGSRELFSLGMIWETSSNLEFCCRLFQWMLRVPGMVVSGLDWTYWKSHYESGASYVSTSDPPKEYTPLTASKYPQAK